VDVVTRTVRSEDVDRLATAFASWPKPRELFETYAQRVAESTIDMVVASIDSQLTANLLIKPTSSYPPFAEAGIPEIADLPDGAGVVLEGVPVPPGTRIMLNDDPELMFTKQLR
jgi:hypothetical protein